MKKRLFKYIIIGIILISIIVVLCFFKKKNLVKYEIVNDEEIVNTFDLDSKTKGYELKEIDSDYYVLISYGMQYNGNNQVIIDNVEFDKNELIITVKLPTEDITEETSYPYVLLKFSKKVPEEIKVIYK